MRFSEQPQQRNRIRPPPRGRRNLQPEPLERIVQMSGEDAVSIVDEVTITVFKPTASRSCCSVQAAVGRVVTRLYLENDIVLRL